MYERRCGCEAAVVTLNVNLCILGMLMLSVGIRMNGMMWIYNTFYPFVASNISSCVCHLDQFKYMLLTLMLVGSMKGRPNHALAHAILSI